MTRTLVAIGTRKGLWLARSNDRNTWSLDGPHFLMREVPSIGIDTRHGQPRLLVGVRSEHWGPTIMRSDDLGQSWDETPEGAIHFPDDNGGTWISIADGLPTDFGFTVVAHPNRGDTLWLIPVTADSERVPPGGQDVRRRGGLDLLVRSGAVIHILPSIAGG